MNRSEVAARRLKLVDVVSQKFQALAPSLGERSRRLWVGAEADALGMGGVVIVAEATGMAISTVRKGRDEVRSSQASANLVRDRRRGAGRKRIEDRDPELLVRLDRLISPTTRGDPESPLRWTTKSARVLAVALQKSGHRISPQKITELLRDRGYSLQGTSRIKEGKQHPDRDAQFEHIRSRTEAFGAHGQPAISVDAKKKEKVGEYGRAGREWQPKGAPVEVQTYDFPEKDGRKAVPYGIYDIGTNSGFVNVGTDHDTPKFAVRSIQKWWDLMGRERYPSATELYITADSGGSNSATSHAWKVQLQEFADRTGLTIEVSHFPPGTSKWNKIEHRLFSFVTLNWRGRPLTSYETIVALIAATTTTAGLRVRAELDEDSYPCGGRVGKHVIKHLELKPGVFHAEWNYRLAPRSAEQIAKSREPRPTFESNRIRWEQLIEQQIASGLNSNQFCRKHGLHYGSFICARRRIKGVINPNISAGVKKANLIRARESPTK